MMVYWSSHLPGFEVHGKGRLHHTVHSHCSSCCRGGVLTFIFHVLSLLLQIRTSHQESFDAYEAQFQAQSWPSKDCWAEQICVHLSLPPLTETVPFKFLSVSMVAFPCRRRQKGILHSWCLFCFVWALQPPLRLGENKSSLEQLTRAGIGPWVLWLQAQCSFLSILSSYPSQTASHFRQHGPTRAYMASWPCCSCAVGPWMGFI